MERKVWVDVAAWGVAFVIAYVGAEVLDRTDVATPHGLGEWAVFFAVSSVVLYALYFVIRTGIERLTRR